MTSTDMSEAQRVARQGRPGRAGFAVWAERLALPAVWLVLIVFFGVLVPDPFLTLDNWATVLGSQAVLFVLVMGALLPSMVGDFDLSLGAVMGLAAMVTAVLNARLGVPIGIACLAGVGVALLAGFVNGLLVVAFDTESLIITLGMGTVLTGLMFRISGSNTIVGVDPALSAWIFTTKLFGIPLEFYYGVVILLVVWYVSTLTPVGLRALFVGQSREVARLSGVRVSRIRWTAMICGAGLAGIAGIFALGTTGAADPTSSNALLLPAYAAVFLGATSIQPGRFNAIGAGIAVFFLATGVNGLQLLGAQNDVQQLFYGAALVLAVVVSRRVRGRSGP
jgi:ribose transport system permease protein